jgi:hypothetical protein
MKKRKTIAPKPAALKPLPKIDAESILRQLAEMRSKIPHLDDETAAAARKILSERRTSDVDRDVTSMDDFDYLSVADGLESLATELGYAIDRMNKKLVADALKVYYHAEELSRDGEHPELIPVVEAMRAAYLKDFGKPIPPKPKEEG